MEAHMLGLTREHCQILNRVVPVITVVMVDDVIGLQREPPCDDPPGRALS